MRIRLSKIEYIWDFDIEESKDCPREESQPEEREQPNEADENEDYWHKKRNDDNKGDDSNEPNGLEGDLENSEEKRSVTKGFSAEELENDDNDVKVWDPEVKENYQASEKSQK